MKAQNICKFPSSNILNELNISRFIFETDKDTMMDPYDLPSKRMILVEQGESTFSFDGVSYPISEGTMIFGFKNENFCMIDGADIRYHYIDFSGHRGENLCTRFGVSPKEFISHLTDKN